MLEDGIVLLVPDSFATGRGVIAPPLNPEKVTRTSKAKGTSEGGDRC